MFPGLMRSPWMPFSSASIAYFHWKWMSAITGTVACSAICFSARASSQCGTATRTMSTPAATSDAICCSVAFTSEVFVVVIDWTETGASPPISTDPSLIFLDVLRSASIMVSIAVRRRRGSSAEDVEHHVPVLGLVQLQQEQPLPPAEQGLAARHGDGVRTSAHDHLRHVGSAVLPLVP